MEDVMDHNKPSSVRWLFFVIGIVATVAYRIIIFLNFYSPIGVKVSWYVGTVGFILYFGYLYTLQHKRVKLIRDYKLLDAMKKIKGIKGGQKEALKYVIRSNAKSKARLNSAIIFILTVLALVIGLILDFGGL